MNINSDDIRRVSTRDLAHNLADFLEIAKTMPLFITKHGREEVVMINPNQYKFEKKRSEKKRSSNIMFSPFIGFNKNNKEWENKTSIQIANNLRKSAWNGE